MRKEKRKSNESSSLVFMNTPVTTDSEDVIGFSTHVEKLKAAIASGGQMIALTSPFGAGKTSIIELLQEKYKDDPQKRIVKISMWSHLSPLGTGKKDENASSNKGDTTELHKGFVYQLISQIDWRKGIYVGRRLNQSFGLLKIQTDKLCYWLYALLSLALFLLGFIFPQKLDISVVSFLGEKVSIILEWLMVFVSIALVAYIVTRAEIVFSSNKSEGGRKIDTNEIMQMYRKEVLQFKSKNTKGETKCHYIVVIEDLDRTDDSEAVINFFVGVGSSRPYFVGSNEPFFVGKLGANQ